MTGAWRPVQPLKKIYCIYDPLPTFFFAFSELSHFTYNEFSGYRQKSALFMGICFTGGGKSRDKSRRPRCFCARLDLVNTGKEGGVGNRAEMRSSELWVVIGGHILLYCT